MAAVIATTTNAQVIPHELDVVISQYPMPDYPLDSDESQLILEHGIIGALIVPVEKALAGEQFATAAEAMAKVVSEAFTEFRRVDRSLDFSDIGRLNEKAKIRGRATVLIQKAWDVFSKFLTQLEAQQSNSTASTPLEISLAEDWEKFNREFAMREVRSVLRGMSADRVVEVVFTAARTNDRFILASLERDPLLKSAPIIAPDALQHARNLQAAWCDVPRYHRKIALENIRSHHDYNRTVAVNALGFETPADEALRLANANSDPLAASGTK
jgi:hypothetical protein